MSPAHKASTCQTFPYFAQLPPELRLKIWEYNLPSSRFVSVRCGYKSEPPPPPPPPPPPSQLTPKHPSPAKPRRRAPKKTASPSPSPSSSRRPPPAGLCTSTAPVPANLHACHESRTAALHRYALMFGMAHQPGTIYFDPDDDILYFGPRDGYMAADAQLRTLLVLADQDELALVSRVALNESVFGDALIATALPSSAAADRVAINLAVDVLHELRMRLPSLTELVIVPRGLDPTSSSTSRAGAALVPLPLPSSLDVPGPQDEIFDSFERFECFDSFGFDGAVMLCHDNSGHARSSRSRCRPTAELTPAALAAAAADTSRLSRQVLAAMRRVCASDPGWVSPRWYILAMSSSGPMPRSRHGRTKQLPYPSCPSTPSSSRSAHIPGR